MEVYMPKNNEKKINLLSEDDITTPEEIINKDKDVDRREAFKKAYENIRLIIPTYFMTNRKRKKSSGNAGGFSQQIVVDVNQAKIETKMEETHNQEKENREREE